MNEFLNQQNERGQKTILPLLYGVSVEEFKEKYPALEHIQCISASEHSCEEIVILLAKELVKRYKG